MLPTLFIVVNSIEAELSVTMLFNVVGNLKQCGKHNIVQSCSQQYCNRLMIFCRIEKEYQPVAKPALKCGHAMQISNHHYSFL